MCSRVLTACSFRSKSIPQQVFHRCRSAEALRLFRVPAAYLTSAFLWFFSILLFRRINNLRRINPPRGSTPTPGTSFLFYARVSTTNHGQDVGLQTGELRQFAEARGWMVAGEYVDAGVSGAK